MTSKIRPRSRLKSIIMSNELYLVLKSRRTRRSRRRIQIEPSTTSCSRLTSRWWSSMRALKSRQRTARSSSNSVRIRRSSCWRRPKRIWSLLKRRVKRRTSRSLALWKLLKRLTSKPRGSKTERRSYSRSATHRRRMCAASSRKCSNWIGQQWTLLLCSTGQVWQLTSYRKISKRWSSRMVRP